LFIKGDVRTTLPHKLPAKVSLLRLDTDSRESTAAELEHLFPNVTPGGVLIIDDYGAFKETRESVDEYFNGKLLLNRIDYTGRIAIKLK
ncbi:macrocin O-methyltransferase, partial [Candidatus Woesearchaeota archaeon]|nr:macrocin O-methyltransferase [Candidatus Woesearchaeota archaeon]